MKKRTAYQDRAIRNYYRTATTSCSSGSESWSTDLFLAEGKAKVRLWNRAAEVLEKLKVPASEIQHLVASDNPTLLANVLEKLLAKLD